MNIRTLALFLLLAVFACKKETPSPEEPTTPPASGNITAQYIINVTDQNGNALNGVTITIGTTSSTSNAEGICQLSSTTFPSGRTSIFANKSGYFKYNGVVEIAAGSQSIDIQLTTITNAGSYSASAGGTISVPNGGSIVFPANAVVDASGAPYTGSVSVAATYIEPTSALSSRMMPNSFLGKNASGTEKFLENHGAIAVELTGSSGQALQIAQGSSATINIPVAAHDQGSAPSTIALYHYNAGTGYWMEEGSANLNGNFYTATVSHFSFWMCPAVYTHYALTGSLNCQSTPFAFQKVEVYNQWGAYLGTATTNSSGFFYGSIPDVLTFDLVVKDPCKSIAYSQVIGPFTSNTTLNPINVCSGSAKHATISGVYKDCQGSPDAAAFCRVQSNGFMQFLPVNAQGQVNGSVLFCNSATTASVKGINFTTNQSGPEEYFTITPSINFGTDTVCGSNSEFVQFKLDGVNYYYTVNAFTQFAATYNSSLNRIGLSVSNGANFNITQFGLIIPGSTPGNYSIGGSNFNYTFNLSGNNGTVNLNTTITQAGTNIGDVVSGSIQNITFVDQGGNNRLLENCFFKFIIK